MKLEDLERFDPVLTSGDKSWSYYSYAEMEPAVSSGDWVRFEDVKKLQPTCPHCQTSMTMCKEWRNMQWEYSWMCQCGPDSDIPDAIEIN